MKNMKKLLQKAMVFTLTAAMLVGTPLTASAAGLVDLYQIEDGWGNVTGNPDNTRTGTVTATGTYSTTLEDGQQEPVGIYLNNSNVELEYPDEGSLTAAIDWGTADGSVPANCQKLNDDMLKHLDWEVKTTDIVALEGKFNGGSRATIKLHPKAAGTATVTVSLPGKFNFSASATVTVKQYATDLAFANDIQQVAYVGDSINLNDYVRRFVDGETVKANGMVTKMGTAREVEKTSDTLTFALKADPANAATLKNGVLTIKKKGTIRVLAIGQNPKKDKVGTDWCTLTIQDGSNAKKIEFIVDNAKTKKATIGVNKSLTLDVTAEVTKRDDESKDCTNRISWSSKKPEIVTVKAPAENLKLAANKSTVTLVAKSAGKTQIIAKTSNGKSATLNVTVSADLTKIEIKNAPGTLYSGQSVELYETAVQSFGPTPGAAGNEGFTDAGLKWSFADSDSKKAAKITAKGVLTINPDTKGVKTIKVIAKSAKKYSGSIVEAKPVSIDLKQVYISDISVTRDKIVKAATANNTGTKINVIKGNDNVNLGETVTYTLAAKGTIEENGTERPLSSEEAKAALGWTASGNGKIVKASKNSDNNGVVTAIKKGSATITINAATKNKSGKWVAFKTTLKDTVKTPTKTLTLSVKKEGIAATGKKQVVSITPVLEKGTTTKKNEIIWTAIKTAKDGTSTKVDAKNGKVTLDKEKYAAGDVITVTARVKNGPTAVKVLKVVVPSKSIAINNKKAVVLDKGVAQTVETKINGTGVPGVDNISKVTYTVNKAGIVRLVDMGDGKLQINPVTNGKVKITATTLDGKKASINVTVKDLSIENNIWSLEQ